MRLRSVIITWFVLALPWGALQAESAGGLVAEGNKAFEAGDFEGALGAYDKASVSAPEAPQIHFNQGAAFYMQGNYEKAREAFANAAGKTKDLALEAQASFALGNTTFRESEKLLDGDLQKSIAKLEESINYYQRALKLNADLKDAAYNMEIARLSIKRILDEIKKRREEQQKQQEQQQEAARKMQDLLDKQEGLKKECKDLQKEQQQGQSVESQAGSQAKRQEEIKGETEKLSKEMEAQSKPPGSGPQEEAREPLEQSAKEQSQAAEDLKKSDLESAQEHQQRAVDKLKEALEKMKDDKSSGQKGEQEQSGQGGKGQDQPEQSPDSQSANQSTAEQQPEQGQVEPSAKPLDEGAHDIIDQEMEQREQREAQGQGRYAPVGKDW